MLSNEAYSSSVRVGSGTGVGVGDGVGDGLGDGVGDGLGMLVGLGVFVGLGESSEPEVGVGSIGAVVETAASVGDCAAPVTTEVVGLGDGMPSVCWFSSFVLICLIINRTTIIMDRKSRTSTIVHIIKSFLRLFFKDIPSVIKKPTSKKSVPASKNSFRRGGRIFAAADGN